MPVTYRQPAERLTIIITEAAEISGASRATIESWVADGIVPSTNVGGRLRLIPKATFLRMIGAEEVTA